MLFNIMKYQRRRCKICSFLNSRNPYFRKTQTNISHEQIPTSSDYTLMCTHYSINVEINRPLRHNYQLQFIKQSRTYPPPWSTAALFLTNLCFLHYLTASKENTNKKTCLGNT